MKQEQPSWPSDRSRRVGMISLGCPKNRVDTEIMLGRLEGEGYQLTESLDQADTVIINTCAFIDEAKQESIDTILEVAARKGSGVDRLVVAGCMVNRYAEELAREIPEIDAFIGLDDLRGVGDLVHLGAPVVRQPGRQGAVAPASSRSRMVFDERDVRRVTTPGYAYLKVAEGCNNPCTFCAIPQWRGTFRSRTIASLLAEARDLVARGAREICLVAQDTTRYGEDLGLGRHGLLQLVEALLQDCEAPWIRFLYAYPSTLDRELLRLMGTEERFCSYLDIPLQHSHPDVLRAMRRAGNDRHYLALLESARELVPDIWLRSTFIVGFPNETEEHYRHLESFVESAALDHVGAFVYSPEEGTPSADLERVSSRTVAEERLRRLLERQRPISLARRQSLVGAQMEVLVEGVCEETEHLLQGRHQGMAPDIDGRLLLAKGESAPGELALVEIVEAYADDLVGHILTPGDALPSQRASLCR